MRLSKQILLTGMCVVTLMPVSMKAQTYIQLADSADQYIKTEKWQLAEQTILSALRLEPGNFNNSLLLSNLGYVQTCLEKYDEAIGNYTVGLAIAPKSTTLLTNRARTLLLDNKPKEAIEDLNKALSLDSTITSARKLRAYALLNCKDYNKAVDDFSYLASDSCKDAEVFAGLGECMFAIGKPDEAVDFFDKALKIEKDETYYFKKILYLTEIDKLPAAWEDIKEALEIFPQSGNLYLLRAYINRLNYRLEDCERDKKIAFDHNADHQIVQLLFGKK